MSARRLKCAGALVSPFASERKISTSCRRRPSRIKLAFLYANWYLGYPIGTIVVFTHSHSSGTRDPLLHVGQRAGQVRDWQGFCLMASPIACPPCGTCSAARGIPLADGSPGPPVLRSHEYPMGVPHMSYHDRVKVESANQAAFIGRVHELGIPWLIEHPTGSMLWTLPCFAPLIKLGRCSHCESCAYGSTRAKRTSFLGPDHVPNLSHMCPGDHVHEEWGQDSSVPI